MVAVFQRIERTGRDLSIHAKLLAMMLGMLSLLLLITIATTLGALGQFEERFSTARLTQERTLLAERFSAEQNTLKESVLVLALDPNLLSAVRAGDQSSLQRLIVPLRVRYNFDYLEIVNAANQPVLGQQPATAEIQEALSLALLTIEHTGVSVTPEGPLFMAAVPLKDTDGVAGAIIVGQLIDDAFLQQINAQRTDPLLFVHATDGRVLAASTGEGAETVENHRLDSQRWERVLAGATVEADTALINQVQHRVLYVPITNGEQAQLVYSIALTTAEIQAFRTSTVAGSIVVLGIVGAIALGALYYIIRRFITRPLRNLSVAAEQLGAGQLDTTLAAGGRDEIGQLTNSFSAMVRQLQQSFTVLEERNVRLEQEITERIRTEEARAQLQEEVALAQATILEMSTPLIPIDEHTLAMPLIGALDTQRAQQVLTTLLQGIEASRARAVILDITGVPVVDTQVAALLIRAAQAVGLLGARVVLTGIRPEVAQSVVGLGVDLAGLTTYSTLDQAVAALTKQKSAQAAPRGLRFEASLR